MPARTCISAGTRPLPAFTRVPLQFRCFMAQFRFRGCRAADNLGSGDTSNASTTGTFLTKLDKRAGHDDIPHNHDAGAPGAGSRVHGSTSAPPACIWSSILWLCVAALASSAQTTGAAVPIQIARASAATAVEYITS